MAKSTLAKRTIVSDSWRAAQSDPTLLLRMAADAKRAGERARRITELRSGIRDPDTGKKLSQERLAAEIHVSSRSVQNWERGGELGDENRKVLAEYFTRKHGRIITQDYIEHGVMKYESSTPDPFGAAVPEDTAAQLVQRLEAIEEEIRLLRLDTLARAMVILQRLDAALPPNEEPRNRRPA